jgi:5'-3' exonuclease
MGIPFYFATLVKNHAGIARGIKHMDTDFLGIDFNCLIHKYLVDTNPVESVVDALEEILKDVCSSKIVYIAFDGLVPYAKIVQQRYRRMCIKEQGLFDRNQISPGTPYMRELESLIKFRFPKIHISTTQEPGEGEHKIFQFIRSLSKPPESICIYGLDADLILLSLFNSNETPFYLLRETQEFDGSKSGFTRMSINALKEQLPIPIEQYLLLSVLCFGNDFMPSLGMFSLREDGYARALEIYSACGSPDLETQSGRFQFLDYCSKSEFKILGERIAHRKRPEEKMILSKDLHCTSRKYSLHILDGVRNIEPVVNAFWKTFHWTMHYFKTNEVLNWNWYYPYADAPLITDIVEFYETECESAPLTFGITNQLQFILPRTSLKNAKRMVKFQDETYVETRLPWMKRHDWEMKPRISLPWQPNSSLTTVSLL